MNSSVPKAPQVSPNSAVSKMMEGDKMPLFIVVGVTVLLFISVILYINFAMKSSNLKGKLLTSTPIRLSKVETAITIANADIPVPSVGREFSYSFWLYVENFTQDVDATNGKALHKMIFYRGAKDQMKNPIVLMDGQSNKLYIIVKTANSSLSLTDNGKLYQIMDGNYYSNPGGSGTNKHMIMSFDYIPLQRWVHVGFVIDNKTITLYLDGEIYSVKTADEFKASRDLPVDDFNNPIPYDLVPDRTEGDIFIGKNAVFGGNKSIDGYLSKLEFFNYALTASDMQKSYSSGPIKGGVLSSLGLSNYGFRAPVYKLSEATQ